MEASLAGLAASTRTEILMRRFANAVEATRDVERRAESVFEELVRIQEEAGDEYGVQLDVALSPGMAAAYSAWKKARLQLRAPS